MPPTTSTVQIAGNELLHRSPVALRTTHFSLPIGETGMSWPESRGAAGMHGCYSVLFKTSFAAQQALGRLTV